MTLHIDGFPKTLFVLNAVSGGGAEISGSKIFEKLHQTNLPVALCALMGDELNRVKRVDVHILNRSWGDGIFKTLNALKEFKVLLKREGFEVVVLNCELPELVGAICAPRHQRILVVEHASRPWSGRRFLGIAIRFLLKMRKAYWVTVNSADQKIWPFNQAALHIPNPYIPTTQMDISSHSDLVVVGRLNKGKNPAIVAEAARREGLSLDYFGDGPLRTSLQKRFEHPLIRFLGYVQDPWSHISKKSLVIIPSHYEGDGMTVIEAILRGNPVLLADNRDLRRFNLNENNYFSGLDELILKLKEFRKVGHRCFEVDHDKVNALSNVRNLDSIVQQWVTVITTVARRF